MAEADKLASSFRRSRTGTLAARAAAIERTKERHAQEADQRLREELEMKQNGNTSLGRNPNLRRSSDADDLL